MDVATAEQSVTMSRRLATENALAAWANVTTIAYGVSIKEMAALGRASIHVKASHSALHSPGAIEIIADVLHDECRQLYG